MNMQNHVPQNFSQIKPSNVSYLLLICMLAGNHFFIHYKKRVAIEDYDDMYIEWKCASSHKLKIVSKMSPQVFSYTLKDLSTTSKVHIEV